MQSAFLLPIKKIPVFIEINRPLYPFVPAIFQTFVPDFNSVYWKCISEGPGFITEQFRHDILLA